MRFNKQELITLATQPSNKFEKEGVLFVRERQESFFRRSEISLERWCRLRGNLLFYFKSRDQWSEPLGVIVLEQCNVRLEPPTSNVPPQIEGQYPFYIVFTGGLCQTLAANSEVERSDWINLLSRASYSNMRLQLQTLRQCIERKPRKNHMTISEWREKRGIVLDMNELPLCEVSLACDNLLCDGNGQPPNPAIAVHAFMPSSRLWLEYATTELVEKCSNAIFLTTIGFRASDGLTSDSQIRFIVYDVREKVSQTAIPIGSACIPLSSLQDAARLRVPLQEPNTKNTVGFLTLNSWTLEAEDRGSSTEHTPCRSIPNNNKTQILSHRRSQSLPPRLGVKLRLPTQAELRLIFSNIYLKTYRFHSGLGGDICVYELMAESRLCFTFPQQLLHVWMTQEKELLQEVAGMGELREPWHSRQIELLDRHLHMLRLYSQARENLQAHKGTMFKPSSRKSDRTLEFAPVNLHFQRMWVHNDTLNKSGFYDIVTVGAFTAHGHKSKNGGLIKLVQQLKESPLKGTQNQGSSKINMAYDAIQAIKLLRREIVEAMKTLMRLAKEKQTNGMIPICDEMISKTRILLSLWDPGLVEEALNFVEEHKIAPNNDDSGVSEDFSLDNMRPSLTLSPFKRITQQLTSLDLKSPDLDDFATPCTPRNVEDIWKLPDGSTKLQSLQKKDDTKTIENLTADVWNLKMQSLNDSQRSDTTYNSKTDDNQFIVYPDVDNEADSTATSLDKKSDDEQKKSIEKSNEQDLGKIFLDTKVMSSSPSANYYKPTDEPEPWDLTQLNIEASVMCLVSKVKFLCGRCGSPAVRLRGQKTVTRSRSFRTQSINNQQKSEDKSENVVTNQPQKTEEKTEPLNTGEELAKVVNTVQRVVRNGNKFTEGLDLATLTDWAAELRPSMRKLRQAMDGLLKTARLAHSVLRLQQDNRTAQRACNVRYRRDVCFSQALTSLVSGLMARLWCQKPDPAFIVSLTALGPLACFEGLLSYYGDEIDMYGDMSVAVEDLRTVTFTLTHSPVLSNHQQQILPQPKITGCRNSLVVLLPVPDAVYSLLPSRQNVSFHVTPVFFNVGINEMATLAESLGATRPQERSNVDNFERLNEYFLRFRKLNLPTSTPINARISSCNSTNKPLNDLIDLLRVAVNSNKSKNVEILHLSAQICRTMKGLRYTSCKSGKDRTGMSVTLEQCQILVSDYHLAEHEFPRALDCMRSEGCRRENAQKNIGIRKYAFNSLQLFTFPRLYRPPAGTYGTAQT
ncbi:inositol polyphosphate-4-phosphatase type I A isoform X2 [Chrysoperla carnea]|uniref:inositol polyphosphate-4-phosphatase type I A isoform X2 n=1 Tax=Chrysoperla carnea TaxID=189513 RepID=UPI001D082986|nr:inositol polyphosphate-4-phosphatase type I A isoform X2 [Chrysoperla carnea]